MKRTAILILCFVVVTSLTSAQNAKTVWDSIKSSTMPNLAPAFQNEFDMPYKQPLADYGWEDGLQISPDGLDLYALYSPIDMLSWNMFAVTHQQSPVCSWLCNMSFMRPYANTYGMDMVTNPFGCDSFPNIDILYAHRNSTNDSFNSWQLSGIARPVYTEGGPSPLFSETDTNKIDLFCFTGNGDIWMIKNTTTNPTGINNAIRLPAPINPDSNEFNADNAFLERVNTDTIMLIYEKYTNPASRVFMYSVSSDTGITWSPPQAITSINNSLGHIEHPCLYKDNTNQWWLYFSIDYTYIVRARQTIGGNWDNWDIPEVIISNGNALSLGEPTVTKNGDISFSLAYKNTVINDSTDVYDLDPWVLPHKTITDLKDKTVNNNLKLNIYPNPFTKEINIEFNLPKESFVTIDIVNVLGETLQTLLPNEKKKAGANTIKYDFETLPNGVYNCIIKTGNYSGHKLMIKQ